MHINDLSDKELLCVFGHLSIVDLCLTARVTCRRWQSLSGEPALWLDLDLSGRSHTLTDHDLSALLARAHPHVERLVLRGCRLLSDEGIMHDACTCARLRVLDVSCTFVSNAGLLSLAAKYPQLTELRCTDCPLVTMALNAFALLTHLTVFADPYERAGCDIEARVGGDEAMAQGPRADARVVRIIAANPNITDLRLSSKTLDDMALLQACGTCRGRLRRLALPDCPWVTGTGLVDAVTSLAQLVFLDVSDTDVTDATLTQFDRHCPNLRALLLSGCIRLTDTGIAHAAGACGRLSELVVNRGERPQPHFSDRGMRKVAMTRPELRAITVQHCAGVTDDGVRLLAGTCHVLRHVDVSGCALVGSDALAALGAGCPLLVTLLCGSCPRVGGSGISRLLAGCLRLRTLDVSRCDRFARLDLTDVAGPFAPSEIIDWKTNPMAKPASPGQRIQMGLNREKRIGSVVHCNLPSADTDRDIPHPQLSLVDLTQCSSIDNSVVLQLARFCPGLAHVNLDGCVLLNDLAIDGLARQCRHLATIDVSGDATGRLTSLLTDSALFALAAFSPNLVSLSLLRNTHYSLAPLKHMLARCKRLTSLAVTASHRVPLPDLVRYAVRSRGRCQVDGFREAVFISEKTKGNYWVRFPECRPVDGAGFV